MDSKPNFILRWIIICLIPIATIIYISCCTTDNTAKVDRLIYGIILACEAVFLFKWVLFETILHHLRKEYALKRKTIYLFFPIILLTIYCIIYFIS